MVLWFALSCSLFSPGEPEVVETEEEEEEGPADEATAHLRLYLQGRKAMEGSRAADSVAWSRPFAGDLLLFFAADRSDSIALLSPDDLAAYGDDTATLDAIARRNMEELLPLRPQPFPQRRMWALDTSNGRTRNDNYGAARLVLHEAWRELQQTVEGDLLAAAPARDAVIFTGSEEPDGVKNIQFLAKAMFEGEPHPVSPQVVRWTETGWQAWEPTGEE
ncbi:MAG: hypothetical protein KTR31_12735 [Myxococcales bacterium]|nr:hypothetical protein [Myxococcales bacterium]